MILLNSEKQCLEGGGGWWEGGREARNEEEEEEEEEEEVVSLGVIMTNTNLPYFSYLFTIQLTFLRFLFTHLHNSLNDISNIIKF
jgi:hypothetical protein